MKFVCMVYKILKKYHVPYKPCTNKLMHMMTYVLQCLLIYIKCVNVIHTYVLT